MSRPDEANRHDHPSANADVAADRAISSLPNAGWVRLRISAELLEDAHPGSGSGGAGIDALVARDRHERPIIWASHLKGLLREAARRLYGDAAADALFGRRGGQRQTFIFTSLYATSNPRTRVWRSTARESFSNRAPREDTLRAIEYVPRHTRFEGHVEAPVGEIDRLTRLLREVDAVGQGRATGSGRVRFTVTVEEGSAGSRRVGQPTERLVLLLRNRDPLCITGTAIPGNLVPSFAFIPGRTLLGALAGWLIGEGDREASSLLVGGKVSVSDALPLPGKHEPQRLADAEILPAPLSLKSEKPDALRGSFPWWSLPPRPLRYFDSWAVENKNKSGRRPDPNLLVYRENRESQWQVYRPFVRVRLRNGRPNGPDQREPSLFAIEQIAEETLFLGEVRGEIEPMRRLAAGLQPVLAGSRWLRLGRGGAPVEVVRWEWTEPPAPVPVSDQEAYLILTSDLLVRDEWLRWRTALDQEGFGQLPGWPPGVSVQPVVQDAVPVHGFNGTSRLWRRPAVAVRRGSVFSIKGSPDVIAGLARAAAEGRWLGERTHEGFGRFRLDKTLPGVSVEESAGAALGSPAGQVPDDSDDSDERIAAITREWFWQHKRLASPDPGRESTRPPSLSQWQDLVADLERERQDALPSRIEPKTAGGRVWTHRDAGAILVKLDQLPSEDRAKYAWFFVRWLRAEMRGSRRGRNA